MQAVPIHLHSNDHVVSKYLNSYGAAIILFNFQKSMLFYTSVDSVNKLL